MGTIRRATTQDQQNIGELAAEVFSVYGSDYGLMIPAYARDVRVITLIYDEDGEMAGFIQVGFLEAASGRPELIADILAVAVSPAYQNRGFGTALFQRVFELIRPMRERGTVMDLRLTVADTNHRGTALFQRLGFRVQIPDYGSYEGGQRAIRMGLGPLPAPDDKA